MVTAGIEPGDRVAIIAGNTERFVEAYLGALGIGAVAVPLNPQSPLAELRREVDLVGASVVVTENVPQSGYGDFDFDRPVPL